jgi:thiosulfate dehydrogenase [quinone] large subunit
MGASAPSHAWEFSATGFLLRLPLGVIFFFAGLGKFIGGYGGFTTDMMKQMSENTWLPELLLYPFVYALPFVEVVVGAFLLVGFLTRPTLFVTALLLTALTFGMALLQNHQTVAQNANYVFMAAVAFFFSRHNLLSLDALLSGKAKRPQWKA